MAIEILHRSFTLEDPTVSDDGRTVTGIAVPYGVEANVVDLSPRGVIRYREMFERGAFSRAVKAPSRVTLVYGHSEGFGDRMGYGQAFEEIDAGLLATFRLDASRADQARDALTTSHRSLSIGFASINPRPMSERDGDLIIRRAVHLAHVAAVPKGAYSGAVVGTIREAVEIEADDEAKAEEKAKATAAEESQRLMAEIDAMVASQAEWAAKINGGPPPAA